MRKFLKRTFLGSLVIVAVVLLGSGFYLYRIATGSLAQLDGSVRVEPLTVAVKVERDDAGIVTIRAANARDRSFAMGYVHAQERFFQMDILRRVAAGELCELVGSAALDVDKEHRLHRFRHHAGRVVQAASAEEREYLDRYAAGVNQGLRNLGAKPMEYFLIGSDPKPWSPDDTVLVLYAMYLDLQGRDYRGERARLVAFQTLPQALAEFLTPKGCEEWDSPLDGVVIPSPPIPSADQVDLRGKDAPAKWIPDPTLPDQFDAMEFGSNNWAVSGKHSKHGGAIVADDMHLGLRVPNIWFRVSLVMSAAESGGQNELVATGVSLPGAPALVVGSNGHIAWGFTNSEGDWSDLVVVELDPADPNKYMTPDGSRTFEKITEHIGVKSEESVPLEIETTIWGPVVGKDAKGRPLVLRWVAYDTEGVNLHSAHMMEKRTLEEALEFAAKCGNPAQNFTVADDGGRIAWTIMGRIPRRRGFDGWLPESWADGSRNWDGYLEPSEYPRVVDPEVGRIWTANARVAGGEMLEKVGFGAYDLGARQKQIKEGLLAIESADEADMLRVQLDDKAHFWQRWRRLLVDLLDEEALAQSPERREVKTILEAGVERAAVDSVAFRLIREYHLRATQRILESLTHPCRAASPDFRILQLPKSIEASVYKLASERPQHLLVAQYADWRSLLLSCLDDVLKEATAGGRSLSEYTWGEFNTLHIVHPLSESLRSSLGNSIVDSMGLDMPHEPVSGGSRHMPRIARPRSGASQRMAVSPGREKEGYFHMPTGQSGHFMSPFYGKGHQDWVQGRPSPFLPGPSTHTLTLEPQ